MRKTLGEAFEQLLRLQYPAGFFTGIGMADQRLRNAAAPGRFKYSIGLLVVAGIEGQITEPVLYRNGVRAGVIVLQIGLPGANGLLLIILFQQDLRQFVIGLLTSPGLAAMAWRKYSLARSRFSDRCSWVPLR